MKTRVLLNIPSETDATSMYRSMGPIARMAEKDIISFVMCNSYNWASIDATCDVLFMQRPFKNDHVLLCNMAKDQNKKVVIDYDDDLLSVPKSNPTYGVYGKEEIKENVTALLKMADHVMVSTKTLKNKFSKLAKKITVVPNALDFKKHGDAYTNRDSETNNLVMWRGSSTHDADLMRFMHPICELIKKHKEYVFHFQGGIPWYFEEAISKFENVTVGKPMDPIEYFKFIKKVRPALWLVPLREEEFNKSKSNIAWIEATMSGSACLCPNWDEWKVPGALNYNNHNDFFLIADDYLTKKTDPRTLNELSWRYIVDNLDLENVNKQRFEILSK